MDSMTGPKPEEISQISLSRHALLSNPAL